MLGSAGSRTPSRAPDEHSPISSVAVAQLRSAWQAKLVGHRDVRALRADSAAWAILDLLPRHLVLSAPVVAETLGLTRKGAGDALATLAEIGILTPHGTTAPVGRGRPAHLYVSAELLGLAGASPLRR